MTSFESQESQILALGDELRKRGWTVSCAESCTGGGIAFALTSVSGSSDWFAQSWVTYANEAKTKLLGVKAETLQTAGAVSEQTVQEMVEGVIANSGAELTVTVSGVAGPGGGSAEKPVGTVWFGFCCNGERFTRRRQFDGTRADVRAQAIQYALDFLYQCLIDSLLP